MNTVNELAVFAVIATESMNGSVADINDVTKATGLTSKFARGVIASLVKKEKVFVDVMPDGSYGYWPIHSIHGACFWCDLGLTEEELIAEMG